MTGNAPEVKIIISFRALEMIEMQKKAAPVPRGGFFMHFCKTNKEKRFTNQTKTAKMSMKGGEAMTQPENNISEEIIRFRAKNNLSQKEFAHLVGLSEKTINRTECGAKPSRITLAKIKMAIEEQEGTK